MDSVHPGLAPFAESNDSLTESIPSRFLENLGLAAMVCSPIGLWLLTITIIETHGLTKSIGRESGSFALLFFSFGISVVALIRWIDRRRALTVAARDGVVRFSYAQNKEGAFPLRKVRWGALPKKKRGKIVSENILISPVVKRKWRDWRPPAVCGWNTHTLYLWKASLELSDKAERAEKERVADAYWRRGEFPDFGPDDKCPVCAQPLTREKAVLLWDGVFYCESCLEAKCAGLAEYARQNERLVLANPPRLRCAVNNLLFLLLIVCVPFTIVARLVVLFSGSDFADWTYFSIVGIPAMLVITFGIAWGMEKSPSVSMRNGTVSFQLGKSWSFRMTITGLKVKTSMEKSDNEKCDCRLLDCHCRAWPLILTRRPRFMFELGALPPFSKMKRQPSIKLSGYEPGEYARIRAFMEIARSS